MLGFLRLEAHPHHHARRNVAPPNESRFCCGAPLDSNTEGQNLAAPSAASAG
jgi:hypothetical protein